MQRNYQDNLRNNRRNDTRYMMDCNCRDTEDESRDRRDNRPLAMAYVPWQKEPDICEDLEKGYRVGTVFPALDFPFCGER